MDNPYIDGIVVFAGEKSRMQLSSAAVYLNATDTTADWVYTYGSKKLTKPLEYSIVMNWSDHVKKSGVSV